jgi:hypothetical protein
MKSKICHQKWVSQKKVGIYNWIAEPSQNGFDG